MKKQVVFRLLVILMLSFSISDVSAQCSMCRRAAESNMEKGDKRGRGLNSGILYLMAVPYVMGGVAGLIWWKYRKGEPPQV